MNDLPVPPEYAYSPGPTGIASANLLTDVSLTDCYKAVAARDYWDNGEVESVEGALQSLALALHHLVDFAAQEGIDLSEPFTETEYARVMYQLGAAYLLDQRNQFAANDNDEKVGKVRFQGFWTLAR